MTNQVYEQFEVLETTGWITVGALKKILDKCPDDMMIAGYDGHITYAFSEPNANEPCLLLLNISNLK